MTLTSKKDRALTLYCLYLTLYPFSSLILLLSHSYSFSPFLIHFLTLSLSFSLSHTLSSSFILLLSHSYSFSLSLILFLTLSLSFSLSHTLSLSLAQYLLSQQQTHNISLSHRQKQCKTLKRTHTQVEPTHTSTLSLTHSFYLHTTNERTRVRETRRRQNHHSTPFLCMANNNIDSDDA